MDYAFGFVSTKSSQSHIDCLPFPSRSYIIFHFRFMSIILSSDKFCEKYSVYV